MNGIEVKNLCRDFEYYEKEAGIKGSLKNLFSRQKQTRHAVNDISFTIAEGEMIGFLGPNGAGKTTTIKMLSGILYPSSGDISINGYVPWERKREFKRQFSYVAGQKSQLWTDLPASESFYLNKQIYEISDAEYNNTLEELVELFGVKDFLKVQVRRLSLGERMKMEMIAALLHKPKVIFLDEPTIGLDFVAQTNIRQFLKEYNQRNKATMILTSHYLRDIEELCQKTMIINHGTIVYNGELEKINKLFSNKRVLHVSFYEEVPRTKLKKYGNLIDCRKTKAEIRVDKERLVEISQRLLSELPIADINIEPIPLEEAIANLYEKGETA